MIKIKVKAVEGFDEEKNEFVKICDDTELQLEHSLLSISKWESKWHKPFLSQKEKTIEEVIDYIRCMTLNNVTNPNVYYNIDRKNFEKINDYISDTMTATTFSDINKNSKEIITSEIIYYWMVSLNIPFECQKWHLNKLLALIKVCSIKNAPEKKMSNSEIMKQNRALNEARKAKLHSRG